MMPTTMVRVFAGALSVLLLVLVTGLSGLATDSAKADTHTDANDKPHGHREKSQEKVLSNGQAEEAHRESQEAAQETGYRALGAHVHGIGELNVAIDGEALLVELISPAMDLVGFEHAPRTEAQRCG